MKKGKYIKTSMLMCFLHGSLRFFVVSILSSAIVAGIEMVTPQIIRIVVDYCLMGDAGTLPGPVVSFLDSAGGRTVLSDKLWMAAAAVGVLAAVSAVFRYLNVYLNTRGTEKMVKTARDLLYSHIESLPFSWHSGNQTGDIIQRCTSDMQTVREFVSEQLVQVIRIVILIVFSVVFMLLMSVKLSLVVFLSVPVLVGYSWYFYFKIGHLFLECDENEGVLSTIAQENLTGVRVVRAFGREEYERERFRKQNHKYTDAWMSLCRILSVYWASGDLLMFVQIMLIVVIGTILCVDGQLTAGALIAFVSYNNQLIWPVRRLGRMLSEMSKAGVSMDRLLYILNSGEETWEGTAEPDMTGDIVFHDVSFGYNDSKEIIKDLSLTIPGGSTVGVLGMTGSGKSTLMYLLNGLYTPDSGRITISGNDIRDISLSWLRRSIGIVLQEPFLFSRTLEENIALAADTDLENVRRAAGIAALDDSVNRFAKGYDTMVGERGVTLSGGQKQRAAIARMLVQDPPVMIFDDSLSAVDAETDAVIRKRLSGVMGDRTVILISHRISTLADADRIVVLDEGRIAEEGTHEELLRAGGLYSRIWAIQNPEEAAAAAACAGPAAVEGRLS
ncbi:MAG: ABC transporter ATP-binding protein [Lachnospiraceae bacterium]|nr:ABC transporter ATP-binding protein [Lachnospiraceae bacterium]